MSPRPGPGQAPPPPTPRPVSIYWRSVVLINSREFPSAAWLLLVAGSSEYSHLYPRPSSPGRQLATAVLIKRQIAEIQAERERVRCVAALVFGFRKKGWFIDVALQLVMAGRLQGGPTARANRRHRRGESRRVGPQLGLARMGGRHSPAPPTLQLATPCNMLPGHKHATGFVNTDNKTIFTGKWTLISSARTFTPTR